MSNIQCFDGIHSNTYNIPVKDSFKHESVCESSQLGKSKKLPFSSSFLVSTFPLEIIHSNVWTSSILSISGYKYYVIIFLMIFQDIHGLFHYMLDLKFLNALLNSNFSLKTYCQGKLNIFNPWWRVL